MLSEHQRAIIRATVPALRGSGEAITRTFYGRLLAAHPELLNVFNPVNQLGEASQARSLAAAVLAYAENIDRPNVLDGMVERIANKHVSLEVAPELYPVVGEYLLAAISEVLGSAAGPDVLDAWCAAYGDLADVMIGCEQELYRRAAAQPGGWSGFKPFLVERRVAESEVMTSFHLVAADGSAPPTHQPGQFVSVKVRPTDGRFDQIRQYSLSNAPNGRFLRISVKREDAPVGALNAPPGRVSSFLHDHVRTGDEIMVHAPGGDFVLGDASERPVVLISGGAGVTAVLPMLEHLVHATARKVAFLHAVRGSSHHAFGTRVRELVSRRAGVRSHTLYGSIGLTDVQGEHYDEIGRLTSEVIARYVRGAEAEFFYCGPAGFMDAVGNALDELAVPHELRHAETFAPDQRFDRT